MACVCSSTAATNFSNDNNTYFLDEDEIRGIIEGTTPKIPSEFINYLKGSHQEENIEFYYHFSRAIEPEFRVSDPRFTNKKEHDMKNG